MLNTMGMHACLSAISLAPFLRVYARHVDTVNESDTPLNLEPKMSQQDQCPPKNYVPNIHPDDIPLRSGGPKVFKSGPNIFNAFIEPQWTVAHQGDDLPRFTLLTGFNTTFGK